MYKETDFRLSQEEFSFKKDSYPLSKINTLTIVGLIFGLLRCSKYALQIEFRHIDETGVQWVNVAKSYSESDNVLFEQQAAALKATLV
ncbi:hypothetical protein [Vibrio sp. 99-70-13A1]|uniref:hypothetical protein n=1 Tax=Vibrio sp. 99-70-13A1 TaxID=2607601 RepID=UPI001493537C|nr:hypothetical protein [Vibrio sp. 99-70-13A1]NOH99393.1 hypothetical protein [Vibrio sp. 99-70-13A1]